MGSLVEFESIRKALRELSDQIGDDDVIYLHNYRPGDFEKEHIQGPDCWCTPLPMTGREVRAYYDHQDS